MGDIFAGHRTHLRGGDGYDCHGVAVECHELDGEGFPVRMDMHDRPDVSGLEIVLSRETGSKHDEVVLIKHLQLRGYSFGLPQMMRSLRGTSPVLRKPWSDPGGAMTASPARTGNPSPSDHIAPSPSMK